MSLLAFQKMHTSLKFHVSRHMALRLAERKISLEYVKTVVRYATMKRNCSKARIVARLNALQKADGNRILTVIAEIKQNDCWLATAYYED